MTKHGHLLTGLSLAVFSGSAPSFVLLGSLFPDVDVLWGMNRKKRTLLNAHRGITHHLLLFPLLIFLFFYSPYEFLKAFSLGYAGHLFFDSLTPLGLPYRASYYPRFSFSLFKTGSFLEYLILILIVLGTGYYVYENPEVWKEVLEKEALALREIFGLISRL